MNVNNQKHKINLSKTNANNTLRLTHSCVNKLKFYKATQH